MASIREKEPSPFTPGSPAPPEMFVGRRADVEELLRYARQACSKRHESVFLSGDRGIGKSSLAAFVRQLCADQMNMLAVHTVLTEVRSLDELVRRVFEQLLKETRTQPWFAKIRDYFGKFVKEIGLFGVSVTFAPPADRLSALVREFPDALKNLWGKISQDKTGLLLVLDDINGLAEQGAFANWYKAVVDHIATHGRELPLMVVFCGLPERRDSLARLQPSLMRIFRVVDIGRLDDADVREFLRQAFARVNTSVDDEALRRMSRFCKGIPAIMHEIGDATYWVDDDGHIDSDDALAGVFRAADQVGRKYLDPQVYRAIRSVRYRTILSKLVDQPDQAFDQQFQKSEVESRLDGEEKKVFHNFLRKMRELGVIEVDRERPRGAYRFVNPMFPVYILMQSKLPKQRNK